LNIKYFLTLLLVSFITSSCISKKEILYFQDIENISNLQKENVNYKTVIRPNDILSIVVSGIDQKTVEPFNPVSTASTSSNQPRLQTYLVDESGNIEMPVIGTMKLGYLTRFEAIELLKKEILKYVNEPVINLRILNFTVSVLGEVQRPGTFTIQDERITVLEALGLAGDMTIFGKRKKIYVVREENNIKSYGELDITSIDFINSPYYYLQQNDVVIVSPNKARIQGAAFNRNTPVFISVAGILISVISVLSR